MFKNGWFNRTKKSKGGFTLVEIIVVLVILAILAAVTIPSMLGFVDEAKKKSVTNEVRTVYLAAQAYATEQFSMGKTDADIKSAIEGTGPLNSNHALYAYLKGDATGTISNVSVQNGKVKAFHYVNKDGVATDYPGFESSLSPAPQPKSATFSIGTDVNSKMGTLAGNKTNIQGFLKATSEQFANSGIDPTDENIDPNKILSADGSECLIYAWYANNNIYYYTEADNVYLNEMSSNLFSGLSAITDISGLQYVDTSNTTSLGGAFTDCSALNNIAPLEDWNTANVIDLGNAFIGCATLSNIEALSNWNTSSVKSLGGTFANCSALHDATALNGWDVTSVSHTTSMFYQTPIDNGKMPTWWDSLQ